MSASAAFDELRAERLRKRARAYGLLFCALWVPLSLFTDGMTFGSVARGLWVRLPTGLAIALVVFWLRRARPLRLMEPIVTATFTFGLAAFGPALPFCTEQNLVPVVLSTIIGAMATAASLTLSWRATAVHLLIVDLAMLGGALWRGAAVGQVPVLIIALSFVMYGPLVFAAVSRDRWQRGEWFARQELLEANARLRQEETVRSQLFVNLSHDLRTPLSVVRSELELLRRASDSPELSRSLDRADANLASVVDLLDQLLELARLSVAKTPCAPVACELGPVVRALAGQLQPSRADVDIVVSERAAPVFAHVDPSQLERILTNLLANAVRQVGRRGGRVELVVGAVFIEVIDDGPGIAPSARARLFERFSSFDREGGTAAGLGLALARELATLNQGTLELVDGAKRTTFRLGLLAAAPGALPAAAPATVRRVAAVAAAGVGSRGTARQRVLLVEDHDGLRGSMVELLSGTFEVQAVATLGAAVAALAAHSPAAVVADIMLPDGSGYDLLAAVRCRQQFDRLPVLLVSALAAPADRVRGLEAGADDYVTKPFSGDELTARLVAAIGRARERGARLEQQRDDLLMELHDGVCSTLTHASLLLASAPMADPALGARVSQTLRKSLAEARSLLDVVGAKDLSWGALVDGLRWQLAETAGHAGITIDFRAEADPRSTPSSVSPALSHALRRIVGEAVTNAVKHGAAARIEVLLECREDGLRLTSVDDGRGAAGAIVEGHGLAIVRRRAARFGGEATFGHRPEGGFRVEARSLREAAPAR